jgi:hypothetical protein
VYVIWPRSGPGFGFSESEEAALPTFDLNDPVVLSIAGSDGLPVLTVDRSDSENDHLYVMWTNTLAPSSLRIMKGSAVLPTQQVVWDTANIGTVTASDAQLPWIAWDECTGMLAAVWLDTRSPAVRETYVAVAATRDSSGAFLAANNLCWTEFKVGMTGATWLPRGYA